MTEHEPDKDTALRAQIDLMKREIDALQIEASRASTPWYRQVPVIVSVLVSVVALLFSFGTTYYSEKRVAREDEQETRAELRVLIQRLTLLPKENFELTRTYARDPLAMQELSGFLNTESIVLAKQAAELISRIPEHVTATEYYAVSTALAQSGLSTQSAELLVRGLDAAEDAPEETAVLRQHAILLYATGDVQGGRAKFEQAMAVFRKYPEENDVFEAQTHLFTQASWAHAELSVGLCGEAREHVRRARFYAEEAGPRFTGQLTAVAQAVDAAC